MKQDILFELDKLLEQRKQQADPNESYTAALLASGLDTILKKIGEESAETIIASKSNDNNAIIHEIADLWFHTMVLLKYHNLNTGDVLKVLKGRLGLSGLKEKASRKS